MNQPILSPIVFERHRLENGLVLLIAENHHLPLLSLGAFVRAGSDCNPLRRPGLAALTCRLLDEGTRRHDWRQISEMVEGAGGALSTFSEREISGISMELRCRDWMLGVELLSEMLAAPRFAEDRFELERGKTLNRLRALQEDPQVVGSDRLRRWIYRGTPLQYPVLGTAESARELTLDGVRQFHRDHYGPGNAILVVVGDVTGAEIVKEVEGRLGSWINPNLQAVPLPALRRQTEPVFDECLMAKEQVSIFVGHLGVARDNPDYHTLQVMDAILGGGPGFTSRIPRRLRDDLGLAYLTYSDISSSSGIYPGSFVAFVSTSPENRSPALAVLLHEIDQLVREGVSAEELSTAQDFLSGSFVFEFQSNASLARFLLATELFGLGADYPQQYLKAIQAVDRGEVHRVARQYLDTVNYTTVVVGPAHDHQHSPPTEWNDQAE